MLREGIWNFQLTAGKYHTGGDGYQPKLIRGTAAYGMNYGLTPFGGAIIAEHYRSAAVGIGKSTGSWGPSPWTVRSPIPSWRTAIANRGRASVSCTPSRSTRWAPTSSWRAIAMRLPVIMISAMRSGSATAGATAFMPAIAGIERSAAGPAFTEQQPETYPIHCALRQQTRTRRAVAQPAAVGGRQPVRQREPPELLGRVRQRSHDSAGLQRWLQAHFLRRLSAGYARPVRLFRSQRELHDVDPLDWGQNNNSTTANFSAAHSKQSGDSYSTGISGTMLDDRRMNYSVSTGHTQSSGQSSNLNCGLQQQHR